MADIKDAGAFGDAELARLVRQGCKIECPVCGKRCMSEAYHPFRSSGIGQHMRSAHPDAADRVDAASKRHEAEQKRAMAAAAEEKRQRPLRNHTVTGAFLDEVASELESLIDMMEPYYSQGNGADDARALIERIEAMHRSNAS